MRDTRDSCVRRPRQPSSNPSRGGERTVRRVGLWETAALRPPFAAPVKRFRPGAPAVRAQACDGNAGGSSVTHRSGRVLRQRRIGLRTGKLRTQMRLPDRQGCWRPESVLRLAQTCVVADGSIVDFILLRNTASLFRRPQSSRSRDKLAAAECESRRTWAS